MKYSAIAILSLMIFTRGCVTDLTAVDNDRVMPVSRLTRFIRSLSVAEEPAQLVGKQANQVSGNSLLNPGATLTGDTWGAYSVQQLDEASEYAEGTLHVTAADSGMAIFALTAPALAATNSVSGSDKDYAVTFFQRGGTSTLGFYENGVFQTSLSGTGPLTNNPQSVRVRVEVASTQEIRFFANGTLVYTSHRIPQLPYRLILTVGASAQVDNVTLGLIQH